MYTRKEGEILEHRNVTQAIDEMCTSPHAGLDKAGDKASKYLEILVYSLRTGSIRNLSVVLTALLETKHRWLLKCIVKPNGLHILSCMLNVHQHSFQMTPILRKTLRVLQHLEKHGVLRGGDLTCRAPRFCTSKFSQILFNLTKQSDRQVRALASTFQKLRFEMLKDHPTHDKCNKHRSA